MRNAAYYFYASKYSHWLPGDINAIFSQVNEFKIL